MSQNKPSLDQLLTVAEQMRPELRDRMSEAGQLRQVPEQSIANMKEAGFFRMMQPGRFGGYEYPPQDFYRVVMEVARGCPSTGWVLSVVGVHSWQLALFPEQAQQDVWGDDSSALISSSYMPCGKVELVEGGYRLSGHWQFSSGCDHCDWVFVGAMIESQNEDEAPMLYTFLLPRSDYRIDDDWFTSGLKASGSKGIVVDDVFVPCHRVHSFLDGYLCASPGHAVNHNPIYKLPFGQVFIRAVSAPSVGAAQGAIDWYCEYNTERINSSGMAAKTLPANLIAAAQAQSTVTTARLKLKNAFESLLACIDNNEAFSPLQRAEFKYDSSNAVGECLSVVQQLLSNSGGRAIYSDNPLNQILQDMIAFRQHAMNDVDKPGRSLGTVLFGGVAEDMFS